MDAVTLLKDVIAIPSVNPMGRDLTGPEYLETRLTGYLVGVFHGLGVEYEQVEVAPGRSNVLARFDSPDPNARTLLLDVHQDTVPIDGMTIDPFDPVERDGRIYGRGACDVKGGMAAMLAAFIRLVQDRPEKAANVVLSLTCDEEATVLGINHLVRSWSEPEPVYRLLPQPPDVAVIAEPTRLDIVVAHRGATRWKLRTTGRACHSSNPANGINAIYRMGEVLRCLQEYADTLPDRVTPHPLCGPPTLNVGLIHGGISVNTVPDFCTIEIDRRIIPGEDGHTIVPEVEAWLKERLDFDVEMLPPWLYGAALPDHNNGPLADRLMEQITEVAGPREKIGVPFGTHASRVAVADVPCVVFGPGSIEQAHTNDEWVPVDELEQAAEVYYRFCAAGG